MNRITPIFARLFAIVLVVGSISSTLASPRTDKIIEEARGAVAEASPDDWHTLAESAEKCLKAGINLKEAAAWLDQSLAIQETAYNLRLKGDYYLNNRLPDRALEYYSKSVRVGKLKDPSYMDAYTQDKIVSIIQQKG